jgi:hypothetical protein
LIAATARALSDSGLTVRGPLRERAGLFVGAVATSAASSAEFRRSIEERGLAQLSATAFTRLVLNAATGVCCQAFALRGPTTTVTVGPGSGLLALIYAAESLASGRSADLLLAGSFDEPDDAAVAGGAGIAGAPWQQTTSRPRGRLGYRGAWWFSVHGEKGARAGGTVPPGDRCGFFGCARTGHLARRGRHAFWVAWTERPGCAVPVRDSSGLPCPAEWPGAGGADRQ